MPSLISLYVCDEGSWLVLKPQLPLALCTISVSHDTVVPDKNRATEIPGREITLQP